MCVCVCGLENLNQLGNFIPETPVRRGHADKGLACRFCGVLRVKRVDLHAFVGRAAKDGPSRFVGVHNKRRGRRLRAARRATEKNLGHRNPIVDKMFSKNENTFKPRRNPRQHKGLPGTGKTAPTSKRAEPLGQTSQAPMYKGSR